MHRLPQTFRVEGQRHETVLLVQRDHDSVSIEQAEDVGEEEVLLVGMLGCGNRTDPEETRSPQSVMNRRKPDRKDAGNRGGRSAAGELVAAILTAAVGIIISALVFRFLF